MKYYKKVQGEKVYLSPGNVNDAEKFVEWLSDPSVTDPLGVSHDVYNIVFEKNWLETNLKNEKIYFFAIVKQCDNQMIGSLSLMDIHQINGTSTIGLFIGDEKNRGKGYGTEAVELG
ncbi:MAG: GNAT family N-acetyltransferase, partial [Oscillospiraceae bacterium]|nr:GNAT family N-acetyltransferase [Oscillospiraceae bacterium]